MCVDCCACVGGRLDVFTTYVVAYVCAVLGPLCDMYKVYMYVLASAYKVGMRLDVSVRMHVLRMYLLVFVNVCECGGVCVCICLRMVLLWSWALRWSFWGRSESSGTR